MLLPSRNITVPVGTLVPGLTRLTTVAVNLSVCPKLDVFADEVIVVHVLAATTVCGNVAEGLPAKFAVPAYTALMLCRLSAVPNVVVNVTLPLFKAPIPRRDVPSRKLTRPTAVPTPGDVVLTVAVNETA